MEGVEPTHSYEYQILSLARLPIPPHRLPGRQPAYGRRKRSGKTIRGSLTRCQRRQEWAGIEESCGPERCKRGEGLAP